MNRHRSHVPAGHTLVELVVAMTASTLLLAGLGSVMMIARQVAYTPSAASRRTETAGVVNQIADELRYATLIIQQTPQTLEFVVADRDADGAAEKIRYEWSGTPGDPLTKKVNSASAVTVLDSASECQFVLQSRILAGQPASRTIDTDAFVRLQSGAASHSRIDAAIPIISRPERLSAYWRADFDATPNPLAIDINADGSADWIATGGATFVSNADAVQSPGELSDGTWLANGDLATNPPNDFTGVTVVEARCKNTNMATSSPDNIADVLRINADRQGAAYAALIVRMQRQLDGSQSLSLLGIPTTGEPITLPPDAGSLLPSSTVDNLTDDYVRFRLVILPVQNKVNLQINDIDVGTFTYPTNAPASPDQCVKILGSGGAKFDYVEIRVQPGT